jgi:DinB superfamily
MEGVTILPSGLPPLAAEDHVCDACGLAYADLTIADAVAEIRELPDAVRAAVNAVPADLRRVRPAPEVWSVTEYACHVRDVFVGFTIRLRRARTEDEPVVDPMFGDLRAVRFRYADADLGAVLDDIGRAAAGFRDEIAETRPEEWTRTIRRLPGEVRTATWLVRQATHEGRHHVRDIAHVARRLDRQTGR